MATKADLRRLVLGHLTVIDPTDDIAAEQATLLDLFIDGATAELKERGLCWWDADEIPSEVTLPLMRYVAALSCASFGKRGKGYEADKDPASRAIAALKSSEAREELRGHYY
ncbi:MAG TPA: hypothetical protein VIO94_15960 [Phenylobacterium sp.]